MEGDAVSNARRVRAFIALPLPPEAGRAVFDAIRPLREAEPEARWVGPENFHFTFCFLGSIDAAALGRVKTALDRALDRTGAFDYSLGGLGVFPTSGPPKVLWIGAQKGANELMEAAGGIRSEMRRANVSFDDKPFLPHLTLARFKKKTSLDIDRFVLKKQTAWGRCEEIILFQSDLTPTGSRYARLHAVALEGNRPS